MNPRFLLWKRRVSRALGGYDAFLSYRHGLDRTRVVAIQRALHKLGKPWWKFRAASVFRDEDGLPLTEAFWPLVESALRDSRHFVLFASPAARDSKWIPRELAVWRSLEPRRPLCIVITGGEVRWDEESRDFDWQYSTALPEALKGFTDHEPLWADLRDLEDADLDLKKDRFRAEALKIAAAIHGTTPEKMASDDLRQHRRTMTLAWSVAALLGSALLAVIALLFSVSAEQWRAEESAKQATLREHRERRQARVARENEARALKAQKEAEDERKRAEDEQARAEREARQALARQLAAQAIAEQNEQLVVAANLSLAAVRLAETVDSRASLLSIAQRHPQLERLVHTGLPLGPQVLQLSGDGRYLAVAAGNAAPRLWTMQDGRPQPFPAATPANAKVAFSPDGAICAIGGDGGRIELWDVPSRRRLRTIETGIPRLHHLALDMGARHVAAGDLTAAVFDTATGGRVAEGISLATEGIFSIRLAARQRLILELGPTVQLVDTARNEVVAFPTLDPPAVASTVAPDGATVALGREDGRIEVHDLSTGTKVAELEGDGLRPAHLRFSSDGTRLAALSGGAGSSHADRARAALSIWDVRAATRVGRRIEGPPAPVWSFAASADLGRVAAITNQSPVWVWDTEAPHQLAAPLERGANEVWRAKLSGDGRTMLVQYLGGRVVVADAGSGGIRQTLFDGAVPRRIRTLDLSADGKYAIVSEGVHDFQAPATITMWRVGVDEPVLQLHDGVDSNTIAVSRDGRLLAWARSRTELVVHDRESQRDAFVTALPFRHPLVVRFTENDRALLLVDSDAFARLDLTTRETHVTKTATMSSHALSGDGRVLAASLHGRQIPTWDTATGRPLGPPLVADVNTLVSRIALNADGSLVAAGTSSGGVLLWDRRAGRRLGAPLVAHDKGVVEVLLSDDGTRMLTREHRGPWHRWRLDAETLRRRACVLANRNLTRDEWAFYVPGREYDAACSAADFVLAGRISGERVDRVR